MSYDDDDRRALRAIKSPQKEVTITYGDSGMWIDGKWKSYDIAEAAKTPNKTKSDGGASSYYDFPAGATTLNDVMEDLATNRWHGDSLHLKDIFKAAWRWGEKEGTTKAYDARKIIYYGARLLMLYAGVQALRDTLQSMLDDKQFNVKGA